MNDVSLRERKKLATQRTIIETARRLVSERGLEQVTVEEIAEAAGVSPRTFFNYFTSKAEAVVATDPTLLVDLAAALRARPDNESPVDSIRAVLFGDNSADTLQRWVLRLELAAQHPRLMSRHLIASAEVDRVLALALAERIGVDPLVEATPRTLAATVLAAARSAVAWWCESDRSRPLPEVVNEAISRVKDPGGW